MNLDDVQRMSWSVSQRLPRTDRRADQAFLELMASCRDLVAGTFNEDDGYELTAFALSGPVEGARYVVRRGRLRFVLSLQRFERSHTSPSLETIPVEIRLVASMGVLSVTEGSSADRTLAGWGVAGCALGTLGLSALVLGSAGLVSAWLQAALLIPALVAWRTCATIGMARGMRRHAELAGALRETNDTVVVDAIARWRRLAPVLSAERELVGTRLGIPPFRSPARELRAVSPSAA